jgi:aminoglycoside phosphotransferase (APT) family kinase protein
VKPGDTSGVYICMPGTRDYYVHDLHGGRGSVPDAFSAQSSRHALSEEDLGETLTVLHTAARRCGHDGRSVG